jgi:aldehyde:ferredoxin oxidoreductase
MYQRFDAQVWADLYAAVTGIELSPAELLRGGERGLNAKRAFSLREGATREDDRAPARFVEEALSVAGELRPALEREALEALIDDYYDERGWTAAGCLRPEKREELGLPL